MAVKNVSKNIKEENIDDQPADYCDQDASEIKNKQSSPSFLL